MQDVAHVQVVLNHSYMIHQQQVLTVPPVAHLPGDVGVSDDLQSLVTARALDTTRSAAPG